MRKRSRRLETRLRPATRRTLNAQPSTLNAQVNAAKDTARVLRAATPADAETIAALATQVFLDTYATEGIRPDLARHAFSEYTVTAFAARLLEPDRAFLVAEEGSGLVGFAEVLLGPLPAPAGGLDGAELVRLYIQPRVQRTGLGRRLLQGAETIAASKGRTSLWLTAWDGNHDAARFYAALGYEDIGETRYTFEGNSYVNRVFARKLPGLPRA